MQTLPKDVILNDIVMSLSYQDLIHFCQSNSQYKSYCDNNQVWQFLLKRDFAYPLQNKYIHFAKKLYFKFNYQLYYFSQYCKLITYDAFTIINDLIPKKYWGKLIENIIKNRQKGYPIVFLNASMVSSLMETIAYTYNGNVRSKNFDFDLKSYYYKKQFDDIGNNIHNCNDYIKIITKPSLVFLNNQLTTIEHDLDIYDLLSVYMYIDCAYQQKQIYNYYKNMLIITNLETIL